MNPNNSIEIDLTNCIGKAYYDIFWDMQEMKNTHYILKGGRGSLKSSFAYLYVVYDMTLHAMQGEITHCVALRKVKDTIKDSVFANLIWAIDMLGLNDYWDSTTSPMKIWFKGGNFNKNDAPSILFRGCANQRDYVKIKSIKFKTGYCKYAIYEEWTEFDGIDETLSINQSLFRGGNEAIAIYMYNPPASRTNWVNEEVRKKVNDRYIHKTTYLQAPEKWLGKVFIDEAENLKMYNPKKYRHMYLGEEIGEGLEIYPTITPENPDGLVEFRTITDEEIQKFDVIYRGLDFGYSHASCYSEVYYNHREQIIYIVDEVYLYNASNGLLASKIFEKSGRQFITADSEDPRTINEMRKMKLNIDGAKKGKDSKAHGIKWVQDRAKIVIDKKRTPHIACDFELYEYKKKDGKIIYEYPKEPDGSASVRYALEKIIIDNKIIFGVKR